MMNIKGIAKRRVTYELLDALEKEDFDLLEYIKQEVEFSFAVMLNEMDKPFTYDILYGEGSYEEFIFGGGAGL